MTPMHECPHFDDCSAPLCPLDPDNEQRSWFSDEDICQRIGMDNAEFVPVQRRISKAGVDRGTYFTVSMLNHNIVISKALQGLDPDSYRPRKDLLESWFKQHKGVSPLSEEAKERKREQMKVINQTRQTQKSDGPVDEDG